MSRTDTATIPMAMSPKSSKRARELAQRMLQLTADEPADISECGTAHGRLHSAGRQSCGNS
jgi:hypothetical protein